MQRNVNYIFQMPCQLHTDDKIFWTDWYEELSEFWPTIHFAVDVNSVHLKITLVCYRRCQKLFN